MANIKARRKLSDLYKKGVEVRFGPEGGRIGPFQDEDGKPIPLGKDEVAVWVQSPSPLQRDMALRDAQASRAKAILRAKRDEESEEHLTSKAFLAEMTLDTLIDYVLTMDAEERRADAIRDVLARDEWKDFTALQEAMRILEEDPDPDLDDPDNKALMEADARYGAQVSERESELLDAQREVLAMRSRDDLEKKALEKRSEIVGSQAFMQEYERQMLFYSARDVDDNGVLFFESPRDLASQDEEVQRVIVEALATFVNEVADAKNSSGAVSGSDSSAPPSEQETSEASTPEESTE